MGWSVLCKAKKSDLNTKFFDSILQVNKDHWNSVLNDNNIYLSIDYLNALQESIGDKIKFRYVTFYKGTTPVAIASFQIIKLSGNELKDIEFIATLKDNVKHKLIDSKKINVLLSGNLFSSGENGFFYSKEITDKEAFNNLSKAIYKLVKLEKEEIPIVLLKEFWPQSFKSADMIKLYEYNEFMIDVNMILAIQTHWKSFSDYMSDMTAKYRTRIKRVLNTSKDLTIKELNLKEIEKYKIEIQVLYMEVLNKANFQLAAMSGQSFVNFKKELGDKFIMHGYFFNNQLIGFSSSFLFNEILDANYVGFNYELNTKYALYPRMLYDFVSLAIDKKVKELRLGRTAEEIKSRMGAEPVNMKLYLRHTNSITNKLIKPILASIKPSSFELRRPFKVEMV